MFESIKVVDGRLVNLEWHQRRVDYSIAKLYGNAMPPDLHNCLKVPAEFTRGVVKCRVSYGPQLGEITFSNYVKKRISSLQLVDSAPFDYGLKYQDRSNLDRLYQLRGNCDDVLLSIDGFITDTSYSNVALFDGTQWYTPEQPLLAGTQRALLLDAGKIHARQIHMGELDDFEKLVLINAMLEFDEEQYVSMANIKLWKGGKISNSE